MYVEVRAAMRRQQGLVTRPQAVALGMEPGSVDRLVRAGTWVRVRRGVYVEAETAAAMDDHRGRRLLADRAASLRIDAPHVMSHDSAAHELGMSILRPRRPITHVTRPGVVGSHLRHGVKHHLAPFAERHVVDVEGRRVLGPARTAVDVCREHGLEAGVVAMDDARRRGVTPGELAGVVAPTMRSWPQVVTVREALALSDAGSDSPGESLTRLLVHELGHGRPQTQFGLASDGRAAWCDLRLGRHVFEFDGRIKYVGRQHGGVADEPAAEVLWREKRRQDWLQSFRLGVSRVVWADLVGDARPRTLARLSAEYRQTCSLFGTSIDDLTPFLARGPRPRPTSHAA